MGGRAVQNDQLAEILGKVKKKFLKVVNPDHPLVYRGPNALLSAPGNLCAIFRFTATERRSPIMMLARVISSRLAYPSNARFILIVSPNDGQHAERLCNDFNASFASNSKKLLEFIYESSELGNTTTIPKEIHQSALARFDVAMRLAEMIDKANPNPSPKVELSNATIRKSIQSRGLEYFSDQRYWANDFPIAISTAKKKSLQKSLAHFSALQMLDDYTLDNGIPYRSQGTGIGFLATEQTPWIMQKQRKLMYRAAFSGLVLTPSNSPDILDVLTERAQQVMARQKHFPYVSSFDEYQ